MAKKPCIECGARPKWGGRHRCIVCAMRHEPIGEQVEAARRRLGMVPEALRIKRVPAYLWPPGQRWCASCQSFVDLADVQGSRCRACNSAATHSARIEKVYGLTSEQYDELLKAQGSRCAICRARPKSKRLAVDHDHKSGAVRGLLCSRCNHDLMGAAWDSLALAEALVRYISAPPATGHWSAPEEDRPETPRRDAVRPASPLLLPGGAPVTPESPEAADGRTAPLGPTRDDLERVGAISDPEHGGRWLVYVGRGEDVAAPF